MKLTGGASATHSFRAYLNRFVDENMRNGTLNSRGVFINRNNAQNAVFQFECFKKMLKFRDGFNGLRNIDNTVLPVIVKGIKAAIAFVIGSCFIMLNV